MIGNNVITSFKEVMSLWKESLNLLINKQFWLVTLKASKESYFLLFRKFWWLILLCVIVDLFYRTELILAGIYLLFHFLGNEGFNFLNILINPAQESNAWLIKKSFDSIWFLLWCLVGFIAFLTVRSSIQKKDYNYFCSYLRSHFFYFVIATLLGWLVRSIYITVFFSNPLKNFLFWNLFFLPLLCTALSFQLFIFPR